MLPTSNDAEKVTYGYGYMPLFLYVCPPPHSLVAAEAMKHQSISVDGSKSDPLKSRQSSVKWIPTNEQARILRDLYHNHGVRSPNVEQIQKISSRLRQYGKIEGKNVFYWFSNYKARERRKRRLSVDFPSSSSSSNTTTPPGACSCINPNLALPSTLSTDAPFHLLAMAVCWFCDVGADATCASPGLHAVGQMGSCECPGSVLTEKSYKVYLYRKFLYVVIYYEYATILRVKRAATVSGSPSLEVCLRLS
ncbi:uncharacterized protein LOC103719906 [Phoenix dactylifera]|uniref:Uncharacterized protein LOC103719906 n=1 Tax=Phoenix dactylifera TaxID=42345 RepID=A0A8B8JBG1_PHODC|nr:uncharacterized protein LOC103719906 [Phoenix dactylifera]